MHRTSGFWIYLVNCPFKINFSPLSVTEGHKQRTIYGCILTIQTSKFSQFGHSPLFFTLSFELSALSQPLSAFSFQLSAFSQSLFQPQSLQPLWLRFTLYGPAHAFVITLQGITQGIRGHGFAGDRAAFSRLEGAVGEHVIFSRETLP